MNLADLEPGESGVVQKLLLTGSQRRRLLNLGLLRDTQRRRLLNIGLLRDTRVQCLGRSPAGDPSAYLIRGAVIALRAKDCQEIILS